MCCMIFISCLILGKACGCVADNMEHSGESPQTSSGGRKPRKRTPNHRWTSEESKALVYFLVDQVHQGMKVPKSFKPPTFKAAAIHINRMFKVDVTHMHVKNHYRVLKSRLRDIRKALKVSGAGWEDVRSEANPRGG